MSLNLTTSTIFYLPSPSHRSSLYASLLSSEIKKRIYHTLPTQSLPSLPESPSTPAIFLSVTPSPNPHIPPSHSAESYVIYSKTDCIFIESLSERGLLFGILRFVREAEFHFTQEYDTPTTRQMLINPDIFIVSTPKFPLRGHQIAYRPKTNTYDAFTIDQMQQEVIDCVMWGANTIEVIPPGLDDFQQSPHFQSSWLQMLSEVSAFCDRIDVMVSIWYPAFFVDYSDKETMEKAISHWKTIFGALARLDKLFVPGGDPGGRDPKIFLEIVEKQADFMRKNFFPKAEVWVSSQFGLAISGDLQLAPWNPKEYETRFYESLNEAKTWLTGVVYGPWTADPIEVFRKNVPSYYPLRNYPDLCHSLKCEFPIQNWEKTYAMTFTREGINPRPKAFQRIFKDQCHLCQGEKGWIGCYSEGVNDDINKVIWSGLSWGVDEKGSMVSQEKILDDVLLQYGRVYGKFEVGEALRELIYVLEENWRWDPVNKEGGFERIWVLCNEIERKISTRDQRNWRLQLILFRAYYDLFLGVRRREEVHLESILIEKLEQNASFNQIFTEITSICHSKPWSETSIYQSYLNHQWPGKAYLPETKNHDKMPNVMLLINRLNMLAGALYQGIGIQLSVIWHGNVHTERGAPFDLAWLPMSDINFLMREMKGIKDSNKNEEESKKGLKKLIETMRNNCLWRFCFGEFSKENIENEIFWVTAQGKKIAFSKCREIGEDPTYFETPYLDYADTNSVEILANISSGNFKRSWLGWVTSIWPYLPVLEFEIPVEKIENFGNFKELILEITYVGKDLWVEGGDWIDFNRTVEPTRLLVNGEEIHGFYEMEEKTRNHRFLLKEEILKKGGLKLRFEVKNMKNITIRTPILPVAEIKILGEEKKI